MPSLSLNIVLDEGAVTRKVKFNTNMTVKQALAVVKDKVIVPDKRMEYALFLRSADNDLAGVWLEDNRTLDYYMLRDGDALDYICKIRTLRVKLLDDTVKTLQVDEAKTVGELMMGICARIGITNYDEYGLCHDEEEETEEAKEVKEGTGTLTLKKKQAKQERDAALEQLSKKLKTDDNVQWLDLHRSLREQGIDPKETLLLKRRLYYSDRNVDSRDPVQLHLLYVQTRDTILKGTHPVTEQEAIKFAGIQCQVQLGDYQEKKHKTGFIENFEEYLPAQYLNAWNIEKKIVKEFSQHQGLSELEAKFLYIKAARALPTYGVTFFLVKEKQKDKKKLVPRLLGINSHAILRLDEVTKEILQEWPLTHVKTYHAGKSQTFTLNFGDYSDKEYSVKTQDCHRIRDILEGYIDIIRRRMLAKPSRDPGESMAICHDNVQQGTSHLIQHVSNNPSKVVTETFVGPNKLMTSEHGSQPQSGTMITTVQQLVVTDHLQNQQMALKGEMPLRGDMSKDCIRKLNNMNSNSVKIVGLLTDPTDHDYEEIQKIVRAMKEDFPDVDKGVKETADKQAIEDAKKMLLEELHDLNNFMNKLDAATTRGHFDREGAKDAAENIADLTTQVYFSLDPKTRRRSELIRRSRNKMKAGEKSEQSMRRASFLAAANSAQHALDSAVHTLHEDYTGPKPDAAQRMNLEKSLEDKMGKLNAAIALYLTAHSDPENIDYASAINSMNAINELMPEIAKDTQILASTLEPSSREQLLDDMQELCDATRAVCGTTSAEDHARMQEATNQYAGIAGKLISTFARGSNADKEHEIIELAKDVGAKTSLLLVSTNELTCQAASEPAAQDVDTAGVRVAGAATDLIACAQLTAPAIHEPHCQSALTAACEGISSSVHQLETAWRPLLEDQTRQPMSDQLHSRVVDVAKALERLKDAYANLGGVDDDDSSLPAQERKRLKFIATMNGAKGRLQGVEDLWNQQSATGVPSDLEKAEAQRRMEQSMAQLNAAIAALAAATADRENPDYVTAELAIATISELMPQIVKDAETVSSDKDEATRNAMHKNIRALCDSTRKICEGDGYKHVDGDEAASFAAASGKLLFLISPGTDKGRQKFIMEEVAIAQGHAAQLVAGARRMQDQVPEHTAAELGSRAARTADAANVLGAVAQVTAPSISSPRCQDALSSAACGLLGRADWLAAGWQLQAHEQPELQPHCALLTDTHQLLADSLHRLADACNVGQGEDVSMTEPSAQQEKKRLRFVRSSAAAKQRLDAAAQQLNKPMKCQMMEEGVATALGEKLNERIAQLNAAVAALAAATADREHPDYEAAEKAVDTISQIMPHLIQDSQKLCGTKSDAEQAAMLQELRALCETTQELCDNAGQPQGVADGIAKYKDASRKLVYCATPRADNEMENEILGLSTDACGKASELLSQVQQLTERVADAGAAAELDRCGASAADAAQALLTVAQATASTIDSPHCKDQLISAAQKLRVCADELTASCEPHTAQLPDARRQLGTSHRQLADCLDKLMKACQRIPEASQSGVSQPQKEKQRLKFMNSLTGARNRLYDSEQQLKQPLVKHQLQPEQAAAVEQRLSQRLAQLNAAVAALAAAKADPKNSDWIAAEQAVKEISELMPLIVQDSRQLSSTKDGAEQAAMLDELKALCHASRTLCENCETDPKISTKEFHKAASKLKFIVSPTADKAKAKQVEEFGKTACKQAERLALNAQTACPAQAPLASRLQEAADTLGSVVQATSSSPSDPSCSAAVHSSADNVRRCAQQLTSSCEPPLMMRPEVWQQLLSCQRELNNDLDKLIQAYQPEHSGTIGAGSEQQKQQRLKFINSASGAKSRLNAAEQLLKEPLVCQLMKEDAGAALQRRLGARVAQLNAAMAALTAATADREHPDYAAADQAIQQIAQLMPQVVQESRTLCGTKSDAEQAAMLQELRALCEATQELCEHAGQAQGVSDAAAKFSAASGKLVYVVSPKAQDAHEKQVMALAATSCGKASELLSQVQQLTERVADAGAAAALDRCGASAADAAQALLTVAQMTAPTISDPQCQKQLISAAQKLRVCADELTASCEPHTAQLPDARRQLGTSHRQLAHCLDKLMQACQSASGADVVLSPQQEQQRLKFVSSMSGAKSKLDTAEQHMKKPVIVEPLQQADTASLQQQLSRRLAQLNAALAALAAATTDGKNPDYPAAERAVTTVIELMPEIVQDSHKICGTKEPAEQVAMMQELKELCEASRIICDSAGHPIKLNEATARLANASSKLLYVVSPESKHPGETTRGPKPAVQPRKPAVPVRDPKHTVTKAVHSGQADGTQGFLDAMRAEETGSHAKTSKTAEEEKLAFKQFLDMIENAERGLKSAEEGLQVLYKAKKSTIAGQTLPALEVVRREQHMEDTLAKAGIEVAALVSANYADKLDYKAAMQPTISLTESVRSVVNDGSAICTSMSDEARKKFLEDMIGLCQSTKILCDTAKSEKEKLNDAAIVFGDQSVKLLRVVSSNVDPALEKEAISRAKAIGDAASRLALEATSLASSTSEANNPGTADSQVRDICAAGTSCVDSAGKLVYTAKLIAPTIHHETCQDALVSSADHLSSSLTTFTNTLAPLASTQQHNVQKLLGEAAYLEKLVEKLRKDTRAGRLGKRREVDPIADLDFPLRNLTEKIIDNAKNMVRDDTISSQMKKEYTDYCSKLEEALRALDLANARYQRAPHDKNKREEFEIAIDELQMTVLQSRPSKAGQEQNNIVDFRDFLQDLVNEAGDLQKIVRKNEGPIGKRTSEDIKMLCSKISEDATRLLNPNDNFGESVHVMNTVDDILDIDLFGQECDNLVKEINNSIQGVQDQKTKQELLAKSLPMLESCHLLRFATKSHIMATQSSAFNETLQNLDHFKSTTMRVLAEEAAKKSVKQTKSYRSSLGEQCCVGRARSRLVRAGQRAARGEPRHVLRALTHVAVAGAANKRATLPETHTNKELAEKPLELSEEPIMNKYIRNLDRIVTSTQGIMCPYATSYKSDTYEPKLKVKKYIKEISDLEYDLHPRKLSTQVLNSDDIDKLLLCPREPVEGTPKQLEEKVQQLSSKLSSMGGAVLLGAASAASASSVASLPRSLRAATQAALQLANTARALADAKKPAQCKMIEDAAHEMCFSTYSLLKTSELVYQEPNHHDSKRKLLEACRHLNDSINKLVRSTGAGQKVTVVRACGEAARGLALHRSMLQAAPRPAGATSYALSVHTMQSQRDVLNKLNSDEAMSREEFLKNMNYAVTAVNNSAECAAQAAYLISVSDQDKSIGLNGPVDVGKLHNAVHAVEETCISIITTNDDIQIAEEKKVLKSQVKDLEDSMRDAIEKTREGELKNMLKECTKDLLDSHQRLDNEQDLGNKDKLISRVADLMHDVSNVSCLLEHSDLVPVATDISADTQKHVDEIVKNSLTLLSNTEELVKQVKAAPEEPETMKWVMFNKRKDVLDAFENLLRSVKTSGQRVNLLEAAVEEPEEEKKSYVEIQFDLASKWLSKPMCKPDVKTKGQEAVRNLMDVANKVAEDLPGSDKEDMRNLIVETEQLLKDCSQKYDQEQYSVLLERVRELKKGVSRGVVSKLVQDFMQAEEPLADLDLIVDYEKDESKRKFMLEKKIAELLAQLGRVTGTARLVAHTHAHRADDINACSQQTELLAPMLVKAAQERIERPDDKAVIENYKSLLTKYAESMSKIRDLCDQSVDPMEFVQTAGETIERMREESTHNDPQHNAHKSAAITKLANRVIHVGLSSSTARRDPELQRALGAAQQQLAAAAPAPGARASRLPDFNDTTARILQATEEVESLLCGETIFKQQPAQDQPIFNEAMNLHVAIRDWSSRDNEIVAVAKRMAVLMAKLSNFMNNDKQREVLVTSKSIVSESHEVARLAKKLAHECTDHRIKTNLLQTCERIPTISGQLKMLTTVKGFSLGRHGTQEDKEAMDMLVGNAQSLMLSIQDVVKGAASASVKIMSQRGPRMKWVRKTVY